MEPVLRRGGEGARQIWETLIRLQVFSASLKACEEREQRRHHCHFKTEIKCQVRLDVSIYTRISIYKHVLIYMPFHIDRSINIDTYFSYHYPRLLDAFIKVI